MRKRKRSRTSIILKVIVTILDHQKCQDKVDIERRKRRGIRINIGIRSIDTGQGHGQEIFPKIMIVGIKNNLRKKKKEMINIKINTNVIIRMIKGTGTRIMIGIIGIVDKTKGIIEKEVEVETDNTIHKSIANIPNKIIRKKNIDEFIKFIFYFYKRINAA